MSLRGAVSSLLSEGRVYLVGRRGTLVAVPLSRYREMSAEQVGDHYVRVSQAEAIELAARLAGDGRAS